MLLFLGANKNNWIGILGGAGNQRANSVVSDSSNNVVIAGYDVAVGSNSQLVKYNSSGTIQWQQATSLAIGNGVCVDSSSNIYTVGSNAVTSGTEVIKYNSSGAVQWQVSFNTSVAGYGIGIDSSSNVYIATYVNTGTYNDILLAKYNTSGVLQWQRRVTGASSQEFTSLFNCVAVDASANVYVAGYTNVLGTGVNAMFLVKYNTSGTLQWQRALDDGGVNDCTARAVSTDSAGNVYLAGNNFNVPIISKYNTSGTLQWQRKLTGISYLVSSCAVDSSNNIYTIGSSTNTSSGTSQIQIVKYNSSGTIQWQRGLDCSSSDTGLSISITSAGDIIVCGYTNVSGSEDFLFAKLPADGSKTGTYTVGSYSFNYAATSGTDAASTLTSSTTSFTSATPTYTSTTSTLTTSTTTLTSTVTTI